MANNVILINRIIMVLEGLICFLFIIEGRKTIQNMQECKKEQDKENAGKYRTIVILLAINLLAEVIHIVRAFPAYLNAQSLDLSDLLVNEITILFAEVLVWYMIRTYRQEIDSWAYRIHIKKQAKEEEEAEAARAAAESTRNQAEEKEEENQNGESDGTDNT